MTAGSIGHITVATMSSVSAMHGVAKMGSAHGASHHSHVKNLDPTATAEVLSAALKHHTHAPQIAHTNHTASLASATLNLAHLSHRPTHSAHAGYAAHTAAASCASHISMHG